MDKKEILKRLERLEATVFSGGKQNGKLLRNKAKDFKGPTGGVRFLISKGFFKNQKKTFTEIKKAFSKEGYIYDRRFIQTSLNSLSKKGGPLIKIKEGRKNYYAERK